MARILLAEHSAALCAMLCVRFSRCADIKAVRTAANANEALNALLSLVPDILILDEKLPGIGDIGRYTDILRRVSSARIIVLTAEKHEAKDGISFFQKSSDSVSFADSLTAYIGRSFLSGGADMILLGASTGGTDALERVLMSLPQNSPPVLIVQHMPPVFTKMYADRLNRSTCFKVCEASDGMRPTSGCCIVAEGAKHMRLLKDRLGYLISSKEGERVSGHCPSVDVLFESAARAAGSRAVAALLTGMGADGAMGMLALKKAGAYTIGQDEESCVVYGMPMEAKRLGALCAEAPLEGIAKAIADRL